MLPLLERCDLAARARAASCCRVLSIHFTMLVVTRGRPAGTPLAHTSLKKSWSGFRPVFCLVSRSHLPFALYASGKRGAPQAFPRRLYEILEEETQEIIGWVKDGEGFMIMDMGRFIHQTLVKYFRRECASRPPLCRRRRRACRRCARRRRRRARSTECGGGGRCASRAPSHPATRPLL
jgi:HSF-type DNA-binding